VWYSTTCAHCGMCPRWSLFKIGISKPLITNRWSWLKMCRSGLVRPWWRLSVPCHQLWYLLIPIVVILSIRGVVSPSASWAISIVESRRHKKQCVVYIYCSIKTSFNSPDSCFITSSGAANDVHNMKIIAFDYYKVFMLVL